MKYILKENIPLRKVSGVDKKTMRCIEAGKAFELDKLPRNLVGKVEEVEKKVKKIKKQEIE
tara:strand:+ start:799 stop:981 length:183 start_codon:yes stop_codon:yes gene_type:complete